MEQLKQCSGPVVNNSLKHVNAIFLGMAYDLWWMVSARLQVGMLASSFSPMSQLETTMKQEEVEQNITWIITLYRPMSKTNNCGTYRSMMEPNWVKQDI